MSGAGAEEADGGTAAAWLAAADGLVAGVHHALNNRLGTVSALVQLTAMGGAPGPDAERALREEMERFGGALRLLGMIPRRPGEEPIPLQLPELLPDVLTLVAQHREVRDVAFAVETAPDLHPVHCPETALTHALLALLVSAGTTARAGGAARVYVRCSGDERRVTVEVEPASGTAAGPPGAAGLVALFVAAGGEAEATGTGVLARLPTLLEARRSL